MRKHAMTALLRCNETAFRHCISTSVFGCSTWNSNQQQTVTNALVMTGYLSCIEHSEQMF